MKNSEIRLALNAAVAVAYDVGRLMKRNVHRIKVVDEARQHDVKLALDKESQRLIETQLLKKFPQIPILGEEGKQGDLDNELRWIVDPIDGTVNYFHGIPHACVSIALQQKTVLRDNTIYEDGYKTIIGVIYDPFTDEMWTAIAGGKTRVNGRVVKVSGRNKLQESILAIGFSKTKGMLRTMLPAFQRLVNKVRKVRIMGAAALSLAYVAGGRMDAYVERGVRLWDIAAGGLMVECAGGIFIHQQISNQHHYFMIACSPELLPDIKKVV
ncbi:MAG: inositol monophosphatase family protein [Verrucomicrobiia bacterium]